jgi:hypothetical protein
LSEDVRNGFDRVKWLAYLACVVVIALISWAREAAVERARAKYVIQPLLEACRVASPLFTTDDTFIAYLQLYGSGGRLDVPYLSVAARRRHAKWKRDAQERYADRATVERKSVYAHFTTPKSRGTMASIPILDLSTPPKAVGVLNLSSEVEVPLIDARFQLAVENWETMADIMFSQLQEAQIPLFEPQATLA